MGAIATYLRNRLPENHADIHSKWNSRCRCDLFSIDFVNHYFFSSLNILSHKIFNIFNICFLLLFLEVLLFLILICCYCRHKKLFHTVSYGRRKKTTFDKRGDKCLNAFGTRGNKRRMMVTVTKLLNRSTRTTWPCSVLKSFTWIIKRFLQTLKRFRRSYKQGKYLL